MPYVTSIERLAKEEGRQEGRQEGRLALLLSLLRRRWGPLTDGLEERISALPFEQLEDLAEALFGFTSLADVKAWLSAQR